MKKQIFIALYFLVFGCGTFFGQGKNTDTLSLGAGRIIVTCHSHSKAISKLQEWIGGKWQNMKIIGGANNRKENLIEYTTNSNYGIWKSTLVYDKRKNVISETELCTSDIGRDRSDRILYTYDEKNRFVSQVTQVNPEDWKNCIKVINAYDSIGKLKNTVDQKWENDKWLNYERYVWVYKGTVIDHGIHQQWDGTNWVLWQQHYYSKSQF